MTKLIEERQIGTRRMAGTDWPILDRIERHSNDPGEGRRWVRWVIWRGLCNGIPDDGRIYRTRREALEAWGSR